MSCQREDKPPAGGATYITNAPNIPLVSWTFVLPLMDGFLAWNQLFASDHSV